MAAGRVTTGERNQRVMVQRVTRSTNAMNEKEEAWADVEKRWAKVEGQGGRELQRAQQTVPQSTHLVTMLADSLTKSLTTDDRLVWFAPGSRSVTLGIVHVDLTMAYQGFVSCLCEAAA